MITLQILMMYIYVYGMSCCLEMSTFFVHLSRLQEELVEYPRYQCPWLRLRSDLISQQVKL